MMLSSSSFSSRDTDMEDMGKRFRAFMNQHWYAEAIDVCRQWLEKSRSVLGPDHPDSLKVMYLLGMAFHAHGKYTDAENIFRQLLELKQDDVTTLDALCETLCNLRKYDESMRLLQDELRLCEDSLGLRHELTIKTLRNIAQVYKLQDNLYLASSVLLRALELSKTGLGENHPIPLAIQEELDEIRGPQDTLALRQALAVKHGLPIPGDVLAGFKTIDASSILLQSYAEVLGFVSGGTDVVNTTMRRLAEMTGHSPQPALHLPSAFESDTSGDEAPEVLESSNYVGVTEVSPIVSTAADPNPTAAVALTRSSDPFRCLVDRSIEVWHRTKTRRGRTRAIAKHSHLLRSVETLDDFLCSPTLQYWFFQLREAFMEQKSFQKWSPDRLDDYILLPIEAGFANDKDCMFISHYWHEPDHPDYHGEDLQPLQELLRDGLWGQITLFWVDFTCLPQRDRTGPQRQYFSRALKSIPRLVRDCAFVWRFSQFQPRLWVLFEAAEFTRNRSRSIPLADIEPFMQHLREMKGYGVRYVLNRHGYRCVNQTDRELVVGWLEILIILSRLVPSIRTRRIILNAIDNSMVRTCFHEQSGIAVDKAKGLITLDDRTYYFNPVPFDEAGPQADVRIPLDSWREAHLRKEILRAERAPDDRGYEEIAKENECEGEYEISEKLHRKSLDIAREKSAIEIIVSLDYLAGNLEKQRRYDEAEKLRREQVTVAAAAAEEQRGPDGELEEKLAMTMQNGRLAMYFRRWKGEALETLLEVERPSFQETGQSHANFAEIADQTPQDLKSQGKFKEAKEMLWLLLEWRKTNLGPYHPKTSMTLSNLGTVFRLEGSLIVAERLFWIALALIDDIWGSEHCNTLAIMSELALTLYSRGMKAEAREIYRQQLERQLKTVDFHHPDTFTVKFNLMEVLDRNETFRVMNGRVQIVSDDRI